MRLFIFGLLLTAACAGSGSATVGYHASGGAVYGSSYHPDLVYVSPGVQVVADYHEPVFYTDGYYWRYYNGIWYRSHVYTGGWSYASPPRTLLRIERPHAYVRYRPHGYVSRRPVYRDDRRPVYRDNRPVYRDNRQPDYRYRQEQPQHPATRPAPSPTDYLRERGDRRDERPREDQRREEARERRGDHDERDRPVIRDHRR